MKKFYTVYKITNLMNGKIYFGQHITKDLLDNYMGSGSELKSDIEKYGIENFKKEIIDVFNNFKDMDDLERLLITENIEDSYNGRVYGSGIKSIQLPDELKDKFDNFHNSLTEDELERFTLYHEKYLYNKYLKKVKMKNNKMKLVNVRHRKIPFSKIASEYYDLHIQLQNPMDDVKDTREKMESLLELSDELSDYLKYVSIESMHSYAFREVAIKNLYDIQQLKYKAKDYGFVVGAIIPSTEIKSLLVKLYMDNGIIKAPKKTILRDWFEINERKIVNGVFNFHFISEKF